MLRLSFFLMVVTFSGILPATENWMKNSGFEEEFKTSAGWNWHGGPFGGGTGKLERSTENAFAGQYCARLQKQGTGATQMMSAMMPLGNTRRISVSLRHCGDNGNLLIDFFHKKTGKYQHTLSPLGEPAGKRVPLKASGEWVTVQEELDIPDAYLADEGAVRLNIQLGGGETKHELLIDEVSVSPLDQPKPKPPAAGLIVTIAEPELLTEKEAGQYSRVPKSVDFEIREGLLYRNGKPYYWVGDGCSLGSAQSTPVGLWLATLQGSSFVALEGGVRFSARQEGRTVRFDFSSFRRAGLHSWTREAARFGLLPEVVVDTGPYKWFGGKKVVDENPELQEFLYDAGHGVLTDHNHPLGRKLLELGRSASVKYTSLLDGVVLELAREPGPAPANQRARQDFREYAKKKYGTLETANQVWRRDYRNWEDVEPPHLDSQNILDYTMQLKLRAKVSRDSHEMYYDWLRFAQLDVAAGLRKEYDDLKKYAPQAAVSVDVRGHRHYNDGYALLDPDLIDNFVDLFFVHQGFSPYDFNRQPADLDTVNRQTTYSLFCYNFFKTNSRCPIWDAENILCRTQLPGSNAEAMKANDIGQFHSAWQFKLDEKKEGFNHGWFNPGFDDSAWGSMTVPGIWDQTKAYEGKSGWAWYRKTFIARANEQDYRDGSRRFLLYGNGIAQRGTIWLNGHKVGEEKGWDTPYRFDVGAYLKFNQENQITVFVDGDGFHNGLRHYLHLLPDDKINTAKPVGEKQYASLLWTYMMRGASAVSLWNWTEDTLRPYMPSLVDEVNSVAEVVLPAMRKRNGKVAYLYSYLYARGLPATADATYNDHLNYYNALEFSQIRPDILSEKNFLEITPETYPFVLIPYARIIQPETWTHVKAYVEAGGVAAVTYDSLLQTFERYADTGFFSLAGIRVTGENNHGTITLNGKPFAIETGDETKSKGVLLELAGATALHRYPDGSPAVTENRFGKGKFVFIAPRLDLYGIREVLCPLLPKPEIRIDSAEKQEFPFIEATLAGNDDRKVLYLHNWGGLDHPLTVTIPEAYAGYTARPVRGTFKRVAGNCFQVTVPSTSPVALLLEKPDVVPLPLKQPDAERNRLFDRLVQLNRNGDGSRPKVLFVEKDDPQLTPVGRTLYPNLLDAVNRFGFETHEAKFKEWTPEFLRQFALVVIDESWSNSYRSALEKNSPWCDNVAAYLKEGGSLLVMCHTASTGNSNADLLRQLTPKFGVGVTRGIAFDPEHCNFGDPGQIRTRNLAEHSITVGVGEVQLYTLRPLTLEGSAKAVVSTPKGEPAVAAGEAGKGRFVVSADLMLFQPRRIGCFGNNRLLWNTLGWLLKAEMPENHTPLLP